MRCRAAGRVGARPSSGATGLEAAGGTCVAGFFFRLDAGALRAAASFSDVAGRLGATEVASATFAPASAPAAPAPRFGAPAFPDAPFRAGFAVFGDDAGCTAGAAAVVVERLLPDAVLRALVPRFFGAAFDAGFSS